MVDYISPEGKTKSEQSKVSKTHNFRHVTTQRL